MLLLLILIGTFLLMTPMASRTNQPTNFIDCLFTSTSATCVTGLSVFDTMSHWSLFGQIVIICLIQIGGLGLMSIISMIFVFLKKQMTLREKMIFIKSSGDGQVTETASLVKKIFLGTLLFELFGTLLLSVRFCPSMGLVHGIYNALFHAVSAFCNAGFDLMGSASPSFTTYIGDPLVNITLMCLIVMGGLGFLVWNDIIYRKFKFKEFKLHTKIVIIATFFLIVLGAAIFYLTEKTKAFSALNVQQSILASLFQSVTLRTAGFFTIDQSSLSESGAIVSMLLMFIGGSPGSTAGGIKTTTFVVLLMDIIYCAKNQDSINVFRRKISKVLIGQASAIAAIYLLCVLISTIIICTIEPFSMREVAFEVVSAIGTVGLSMGITAKLHTFSKLILITLMYAGRIGGLTLALVMAERNKKVPIKRPKERIMIG